MKSPIRKKTAKDIDQDFSQPVSQSYHNKNDNSKFSLEKALSETDDFNQGKFKQFIIINIVTLVDGCNIINILIVKYLELMVNCKMYCVYHIYL